MAVLLAAMHLLWLGQYVVIGYASPDADGYFAQAGMMVREGRTTFEPESPVQYIGMHWIEKPDGLFISRYPAGFPALLAAAWGVFGRETAFWVNPVLASLTVLAVFLLCRRWTGDGPALAAAAVQAASLIVNSHALNSDSHTSTGFFLLAGILALDRWLRDGRIWQAASAGLLLGMVPAIRYAEAVAGVGVALFLWFAWKRPERRMQIAWMAGAAALPLGWTLWRNQIHFGAFWRTAYSLTGESSLSLRYFLENWPSYVDGLLTSGAGLFVPLAFLGMASMMRREESRPLGALLAATTVGVTLVYCCYYFNTGRPDRFLMPIVPLFFLPAIVFLRESAPGRAFPAALLVLASLQGVRAASGTAERMGSQRASAERSAIALAWLENNVPEGSLIVGDRQLNEQIHFAGKWKLADASLLVGSRGRRFAGPGGPGGAGGPGGRRGRRGGEDRPSPMQEGKAEALRARYAGLSAKQRSGLAAEDVRAWAEGAEIYWAGDERDAESASRALGMTAEAGRIEMPGDTREERSPFLGGPFEKTAPGGPGAAMTARARRPQPGRGGPGGGGGPRFGLSAETLVVRRAEP